MLFNENRERTMKQRTCDKCHKVIESGTDYYKVAKLTHNENKKNYTLFHAGDICPPCWEGIKK